MILADTSAWIDFLRGTDTRSNVLLAEAVEQNDVLLGDLIVVELLSGFKAGRQLKEFEAVLAPFPVYSLCGKMMAQKTAENYRTLRNKGVTARGIVDVIIATWCIENDVPLLYADRYFEPMEKILGLQRWEG